MGSEREVRELTFDSIDAYMQVPISFTVKERLIPKADGQFDTLPEPQPWIKDYDTYADEGPRSYPSRFIVDSWGVLAAFDEGRVVGGVILAFQCPEFNLLEGRNDLVHIVDIRIAPTHRGQGVGRQLWEAAESWSRSRGATEIRVETQDINAPACQFYQAMGCLLISCSEGVYGQEIGELQLIFGKRII